MSRYKLMLKPAAPAPTYMVYATLYDTTLPEGHQILHIGPLESVVEHLLELEKEPQISMAYES